MVGPALVTTALDHGIALHRQGKLAAAAPYYLQALQENPLDPHTAAVVAEWYGHRGDYEQGYDLLKVVAEAVQVTGEVGADDFAMMQAMLGWLAYMRHDLDTADDHLITAVSLKPTLPQAWGYMGQVASVRGRWGVAGRMFRHSMAQDATSPGTRFAYGQWLLRQGVWKKGWAHYEGRLEMPGYAEKHQQATGIPMWMGQSLAGKSILVQPEQGAGDLLQFCRYLPRLAEMGATVWFGVGLGLERLIRLNARRLGIAGVIGFGDMLPEGLDYQVSLMSLPHRLRVGAPQWDAAYLSAGPVVHRGGTGYCYKGNPKHQNDGYRSTPLDLWPIQSDWVSLQHGEGLEGDYLDTAQLIASLNHVITVDTSVAHLAGALGVPTTVLLPANVDWRWGNGHNPNWYGPTFRTLRQNDLGDWPPVFSQLAVVCGIDTLQPA